MKKQNLERNMTLVTGILAVIGLVCFLLSFSTGYFVLGEKNSAVTLCSLVGAIVLEALLLAGYKKYGHTVVYQMLTFAVTGLLVWSIGGIMSDRVEAIGTCVLTDYDSGHGGEEACYISFGACAALLIATVTNVIGSFAPAKKDSPNA